jgi:hypothetical protein
MRIAGMDMSRRDWSILAGITAGCFLLGILASMWSPHLKNGLWRIPARAIVKADPACNPVGQACAAGDAALTITLELAAHIRPLTLFPLQVRLTGEEASEVRKVAVSFTMPNMDMGFNRFDLRQQADETWQGQALLPVCSMGRRDWRVTVEVIGKRSYVGEFHLLASF